MKKALFLACLCMGISTYYVKAQTQAKAPGWTNLETKPFYLNDISTRAAGDFVKRYSGAADAKWYKTDDGYIVKFLLKDIKHKSAYDKSGTWVYTIKHYDESKMPRDIRHIVKRQYYDYTISQVEEVNYLNNPVSYIVHMQDEKTWMNVKVCEQELSVLEKYNKN